MAGGASVLVLGQTQPLRSKHQARSSLAQPGLRLALDLQTTAYAPMLVVHTALGAIQLGASSTGASMHILLLTGTGNGGLDAGSWGVARCARLESLVLTQFIYLEQLQALRGLHTCSSQSSEASLSACSILVTWPRIT